MATYAVGDIQGRYNDFLRLLDRIGFSPERDNLILLGDLVNRGPNSLEVVRFAMSHTSSVETVLGNHDCLLYTSPSPRDRTRSRMPSSA